MNQQNKPEEQKEHRFDPELLKQGLKCDLDQYEMLKRCSDKKDISEWNNWRKENPREKIWLEGANLYLAYLSRAYLTEAHLKEAMFRNAKMEKSHFREAFLQGADFTDARLEYTDFSEAHLENTNFEKSYLQQAKLTKSHLEGAKLSNAHLEGAILEEAFLMSTHLFGTRVDSNTNMWKVKVNKFTISSAKSWDFTDFSGVQLHNVIIDPATQQLIEYNIRRKYWYKWINQKNWNEVLTNENKAIKRFFFSKLIRYSVHLFFGISDYGKSTCRIIGWFFGLAFFFAALYSNFAYWFPPGVISNFEVEAHLPLWHYFILLILRPVYFSIVTMTTLGFGDMYANPNSIFGHFFLTFQVILGYVLLGALVIRFAVLFTAGGPAGKFEDEGPQKQ